MGVLVVLLAILNRFRTTAPALISRLVLRIQEARRAAGVLVVGLVIFLGSHVVELYGDLIGTPVAEAAHEVVETTSLFFLFASGLWFWNMVRIKADPSRIVRLSEAPR